MCRCMGPPIRERALSVDKDTVDGQLPVGMRASRSFEVLPRNKGEGQTEGEEHGHDRLSTSMSSYHSGPSGASPM